MVKSFFGFDPLDVPTNYRGLKQMIVTIPWLKEHLKTSAKENEIIDRLTNIGLEVEGVKENSGEMGKFKIAKVLKTEKHPNADKLKICDKYWWKRNFKSCLRSKMPEKDWSQFMHLQEL